MRRRQLVLSFVVLAVLAFASQALAGKSREIGSNAFGYPEARTLKCGLDSKHFVRGRRRGYERGTNPLARALRQFIRAGGTARLGQPNRGWSLVFADDEGASVVAHGSPRFGILRFKKAAGAWAFEGLGRCRPRAHRRGGDPAKWDLAGPPSAASRTVLVDVSSEAGCNGGADELNLVLRPRVHYGKRAITITFHTRTLRGNFTCEAVEYPPFRVRLREAVGSRSFRDGSYYRSRRVTFEPVASPCYAPSGATSC
jgi:hypothetical protein